MLPHPSQLPFKLSESHRATPTPLCSALKIMQYKSIEQILWLGAFLAPARADQGPVLPTGHLVHSALSGKEELFLAHHDIGISSLLSARYLCRVQPGRTPVLCTNPPVFHGGRGGSRACAWACAWGMRMLSCHRSVALPLAGLEACS